MVGVAVLLVAAGCSAGGSGSPTTPAPVSTLPEIPNPPPPISVERGDVDFGDLRRLVGSWELVSFPGEPFAPQIPTLTFGYLRTNETGLSYDMYRDGLCRQRWGSYTVAGNQIRANTNGWNLLIRDPCEDDSEFRLFGSWLWQAVTWSVEGELLTITSVDGVTGEFRRVVEFPDPQLVEDDGLETVAPRLHFVDESGFLARIQEQEEGDGWHGSEILNWLAWTPGSAQETPEGPAWRTEVVVSPNSWDFYRRLRDYFVAVEYSESFEEPCLLADMNSLHGINTASVRYRRTELGAELLVDEEGSSSPETGHTDEVLGLLVADCSGDASVPGVKIGRVDGVTGEWTRVDYGQLILDPVVVAGPASLNGSDPGVVEVRNVTSLSFEIRFHEWDYLDGIHTTGETVSYVVTERGITVLPSGAHIEAGTIAATPTMTEVLFESPFPETPVVISTVLR
jgi:hypothetical protein